jgi:hypothetical protein
LAHSLVFGELLNGEHYVLRYPFREGLLSFPVGTRRRVLLVDRCQALDRDRSARRTSAGHRRRWMSVTFPFTSLVRTTSGESATTFKTSKMARLDG